MMSSPRCARSVHSQLQYLDQVNVQQLSNGTKSASSIGCKIAADYPMALQHFAIVQSKRQASSSALVCQTIFCKRRLLGSPSMLIGSPGCLQQEYFGFKSIERLFQVQEENLQQAEVCANQALRIEAINTDLQDTQKLLAALQSESSVTVMNLAANPHRNDIAVQTDSPVLVCLHPLMRIDNNWMSRYWCDSLVSYV